MNYINCLNQYVGHAIWVTDIDSGSARRHARATPGQAGYHLLLENGAAEIDESKQQEEHKGQGQGKLQQRLAGLALPGLPACRMILP